MKEVPKEEFWKFIGDKDAIHEIVSDYPYTSQWRLRGGTREVIARAVPYGFHIGVTDDKYNYFIKK